LSWGDESKIATAFILDRSRRNAKQKPLTVNRILAMMKVMSKKTITVFLCAGKDCRKDWRRICDGSPGKWLKHQVAETGLPYKLKIVKTECMDLCEDAACLCFARDEIAHLETQIRCAHDADRLLASLRACAEKGLDAPSLVDGFAENPVDFSG
jgi:predicted metal-binding protein